MSTDLTRLHINSPLKPQGTSWQSGRSSHTTPGSVHVKQKRPFCIWLRRYVSVKPCPIFIWNKWNMEEKKRPAFILIWLSGSLGLFLALRSSGITTKHISSFCRIAMASTLFLLVTWEHRDPPPALPWASVLWIKRVSQWTRDLGRLPSATSKWVTEIRGNAPQQRAHGFAVGKCLEKVQVAGQP